MEMATPEQPEGGSEPIEELLASPELAQAIETDDYQRLLDCLPLPIAVSKRVGGQRRITYRNPAFEKLVGTSVRAGDWSILADFVRDDDSGLSLDRAMAEGDDFLGLFRREADDKNARVVVQAYIGRIDDDEGSEKYRLIAFVDVSDQEPSQRDELERQIRDKDLLLREMQHRVKNNLQLIVGLIRLEARSAHRGESVDLDRLAHRIDALQALYQTMTVEGWGEEIDLGQYLSQIASSLVRAHAHERIVLDTQANFSPVSINIALPIGLAVNELLTNAFKHAFGERDAGRIRLECVREDSHYRVLVADDGVGLPPGVTWPVPGKLGALIMQSLRENARVELTVESVPEQGTTVELEFDFNARTAKTN
jgi:two-component sensor histidine kinase